MLIERINGFEKILKNNEKEEKKKQKLAQYNTLNKNYVKAKADLDLINSKFYKNVSNIYSNL